MRSPSLRFIVSTLCGFFTLVTIMILAGQGHSLILWGCVSIVPNMLDNALGHPLFKDAWWEIGMAVTAGLPAITVTLVINVILRRMGDRRASIKTGLPQVSAEIEEPK